MNDNKQKKEVLKKAIGKIEKTYGKGSIMFLGEESSVQNIETISSGSVAIDIASGVGGYPRGRIIEIYGPESSGKTTIALHAIASAQKTGGIAAFIDAEHALDPVYAKNLGVNVENLLIAQPDYGEQALEIVDELVRSNAVDLIVIDSVAALVPRAEIEGAMGDVQVGLQARLMSQALRKLAGNINKSKTVVIFINQTRMKIGVMYGNPETTTGGVALKFYATMRLEVRSIGKITEGKENIGNQVRIKFVKNKVAPPFKEAIVDVIYGRGIVRENELFNLAVDEGLISRRGSWFSYVDSSGTEHSLGQGKNNSLEYLLNHPELLNEIEEKIREKHGLLKKGEASEEESPK
ncbi:MULTISPECIES: recombinase RecA [unclassified Thermosipho (in: thermotogales)]|uniref:recombinase RecA n=1 Tax=unclassified Thermosipho (in: thermotogales) TaxID=2676525 RepID=UPI000984C6EA|nr:MULTISPECIES: recombinase RecA [unclassified Thermosipho (in: thermotogales)]MBT1248228.1 DNA recombination/repair protein RecA [Thermosipho sp. 1244]OOC46486.1 recombinase RecA [Thermosipho sp. 1223]